jgi:16S rRNA processing protein RimM
VAQVRGVRGLDGTLRLESLTDRPERWFAPGSSLVVEGAGRTITLLETSPGAPGLFARFAEVASRAAAERLVGSFLSGSDADPAEPGRVYWDDVIGLVVRDRDGAEIGTVVDCYRAGGAEVYLLRTPDGGELDLPAVASVIVDFRPREGVITADLGGSELSVRRPRLRRSPERAR